MVENGRIEKDMFYESWNITLPPKPGKVVNSPEAENSEIYIVLKIV